jgi:hypothetical protein
VWYAPILAWLGVKETNGSIMDLGDVDSDEDDPERDVDDCGNGYDDDKATVEPDDGGGPYLRLMRRVKRRGRRDCAHQTPAAPSSAADTTMEPSVASDVPRESAAPTPVISKIPFGEVSAAELGCEPGQESVTQLMSQLALEGVRAETRNRRRPVLSEGKGNSSS